MGQWWGAGIGLRLCSQKQVSPLRDVLSHFAAMISKAAWVEDQACSARPQRPGAIPAFLVQPLLLAECSLRTRRAYLQMKVFTQGPV